MKTVVCLSSLMQTVFHLSWRKVTLGHAKGHQHQGRKEGYVCRNNECKDQGEGRRHGGEREIGSPEPDTSCRSCTAANSQTSDTEVVCVSGKGCNPRNLKTNRYKQLLNLLASLISHS